MQLISKYFYTERVYDDSASIYPKLRWRYRNSYSDDLANSQRRLDYELSDNSFDDSYDDSENSAQSSSKEASDGAKTTHDSKPIFVRFLSCCFWIRWYWYFWWEVTLPPLLRCPSAITFMLISTLMGLISICALQNNVIKSMQK